jgi:shikimate dehydrogenase
MADNFDATADDFFAAGGRGLNCTVPLKELAWRYADQLTERARLARAVNTLAVAADGGVSGDNTDGIGLVIDLTENHHLELIGKRILILGAGGACRGIIAPLLERQPELLLIANRTPGKAEAIVQDFSGLGQLATTDFEHLAGEHFDLIINATSASLSGQLPPLAVDLLAAGGYCYDLAYGNQPTAFVEWGYANHAKKSLDGLGMLVEQAAEAFFVWRGIRPSTKALIDTLNNERKASN